MDIKLFYRTQRELATALNGIVDGYWENLITEEDMISKVSGLYVNNPKKIWKDHNFTKILKQQCGKRRLEVIGRVLIMNGMIVDINSIVVESRELNHDYRIRI